MPVVPGDVIVAEVAETFGVIIVAEVAETFGSLTLKVTTMTARLNRSLAGSLVFTALIIAGCESKPAPEVSPLQSASVPGDESATRATPALVVEASESGSEHDIASTQPLASTPEGRPATDTEHATLAKQSELSQPDDNHSQASAPPPPTPEELKRWAIPEHSPLQLLACYDDFSDSLVQTLAISPDGKKFALGGGRLTIWSITEPTPTIDLLENMAADHIERPIRSLAISPDGKLLAAGDQAGRLIVWNMQDLQQVYSIAAHEGRLLQLAFSPNSEQLATSSYSGEVRLWKASDGEKIKSLVASNFELTRLVFVSDQLLACSGDDVTIWNVDSGHQSNVLTTGYAAGRALALSANQQLLIFGDRDGALKIWDTATDSIAGGASLDGSAAVISFSSDNLRIAANSPDRTLRIWDMASRKLLQVIDADGGRTADLKWIPGTQVLLVATEEGRVRLWGQPDAAKSLGFSPIQSPVYEPIADGAQRPMSSGQLTKIIDLRSFPGLPGAVPQWGDIQSNSYGVNASPAEAEQFYRYVLHQAGWSEVVSSQPTSMAFRKHGCLLNVSIMPTTTPNAGDGGDLQISLNFAGNYDVRWLPKFAAIESKNNFESFGFCSYRAHASLTDMEVALLKQFHALGWTAYSRLDSSSDEDPVARRFSMLQGGNELSVSIGYPAEATSEINVQVGVRLTNKSLPIPPDCGLVEFDSSTNTKVVATTKLSFEQTIEFYDLELPREGWQSRESSRRVGEGQAWLAFIRGQQDVVVRLKKLPDSRTRILVGEAEKNSWQLQQPAQLDPNVAVAGIEAADLAIPKTAINIKYDSDQKQIQFELPDVTPLNLAIQYEEQLSKLDFKRDPSGVSSDEYVLASYIRGPAEIELRARAVDVKNSATIISGDGLLWTKALPAPPMRISYETWLRRHRYDATLDRLDEFSAEMLSIADSLTPKP